MPVTSPAQMTAAFEAAYNARDKARLTELYTPDAVHTFDGQKISVGRPDIIAAFDGGFARGVILRGETLSCLMRGDLALLRVEWRSVDPNGRTLHSNISCEVVAKDLDGNWRYIIDDASGGSRAA